MTGNWLRIEIRFPASTMCFLIVVTTSTSVSIRESRINCDRNVELTADTCLMLMSRLCGGMHSLCTRLLGVVKVT